MVIFIAGVGFHVIPTIIVGVIAVTLLNAADARTPSPNP